jgi:hypothetical protein
MSRPTAIRHSSLFVLCHSPLPMPHMLTEEPDAAAVIYSVDSNTGCDPLRDTSMALSSSWVRLWLHRQADRHQLHFPSMYPVNSALPVVMTEQEYESVVMQVNQALVHSSMHVKFMVLLSILLKLWFICLLALIVVLTVEYPRPANCVLSGRWSCVSGAALSWGVAWAVCEVVLLLWDVFLRKHCDRCRYLRIAGVLSEFDCEDDSGRVTVRVLLRNEQGRVSRMRKAKLLFLTREQRDEE